MVSRDATRLGRNPGAAFDLVFLDPPYGQGLGERALTSAMAGGWVAPGALVVWEEGVNQTAAARLDPARLPPLWRHHDRDLPQHRPAARLRDMSVAR